MTSGAAPAPTPPGGNPIIPNKVFIGYIGASGATSECAKKAVDQGINVLVIAFYKYFISDEKGDDINKLLAIDADGNPGDAQTKALMNIIDDLQEYRKQNKC